MRLNIKGEIFSDEWAELYRYYGFNTGFFCPADLRSAIQQLEEDEELVLEINSPGGLVDAGSEIYSIIQACTHPVIAQIQSLAASAASYLCLACDRVEISRPAQMMIHCGSWCMDGNKFDHQWVARQLDTTDRSILDTYCAKCGDKTTREELERLMVEETYLSASDCVRLGLADAIIGEEQTETPPMGLTASVAGNLMRAMRTLPDIRELKARRSRETNPQPVADLDWKARARLDLETQRYFAGGCPL